MSESSYYHHHHHHRLVSPSLCKQASKQACIYPFFFSLILFLCYMKNASLSAALRPPRPSPPPHAIRCSARPTILLSSSPLLLLLHHHHLNRAFRHQSHQHRPTALASSQTTKARIFPSPRLLHTLAVHIFSSAAAPICVIGARLPASFHHFALLQDTAPMLV